MGHCCQKMKRNEADATEGAENQTSKLSDAPEGEEGDANSGKYKQKENNHVSNANGKKPHGKRKNGSADKYEVNYEEEIDVGHNERSVDLPSEVQIKNNISNANKNGAQVKQENEFEEINLNLRYPSENHEETIRDTEPPNEIKTSETSEDKCHDNPGFEVETGESNSPKKESDKTDEDGNVSLNVEQYKLTPESEAKRLLHLKQDSTSDDESLDYNSDTQFVVSNKNEQNEEQLDSENTIIEISQMDKMSDETDLFTETKCDNLPPIEQKIDIVPSINDNIPIGITNEAFENDIDIEFKQQSENNAAVFLEIEGAHAEESFTDADEFIINKLNNNSVEICEEVLPKTEVNPSDREQRATPESCSESDFSSESNESFSSQELIRHNLCANIITSQSPKDDFVQEKATADHETKLNISEEKFKVTQEIETNLSDTDFEKPYNVNDLHQTETIELGDIIVSKVSDSDSDNDLSMIPKQTVVIPIEEKRDLSLHNTSMDGDELAYSDTEVNTIEFGHRNIVDKRSPIDPRLSYGEQEYLLESMTLPMDTTIDRGPPEVMTNQQQNVLSALDAALAARDDTGDSDEEIKMNSTSKSYGEAEYLSESLVMSLGHTNVSYEQSQDLSDKSNKAVHNASSFESSANPEMEYRVKHIMTKYGDMSKKKQVEKQPKLDETRESNSEGDYGGERLTLSLEELTDTKLPLDYSDEDDKLNNISNDNSKDLFKINMHDEYHAQQSENIIKGPYTEAVSATGPAQSKEQVGSPELSSSGEMSRFKWPSSPRSEDEDIPKVKKQIDLNKLKLRSIDLSDSHKLSTESTNDVQSCESTLSKQDYHTNENQGKGVDFKSIFSSKTRSPVRNRTELAESTDRKLRPSVNSPGNRRIIEDENIVGDKSESGVILGSQLQPQESEVSASELIYPISTDSQLQESDNNYNPWGTFTEKKDGVNNTSNPIETYKPKNNNVAKSKEISDIRNTHGDPFDIKISEQKSKVSFFGYPVNTSEVVVTNNVENVVFSQDNSNVQISMPLEEVTAASDITRVTQDKESHFDPVPTGDNSPIAQMAVSSKSVELPDNELTPDFQIYMPSEESQICSVAEKSGNTENDNANIDIVNENLNCENIHLESSESNVNVTVSTEKIVGANNDSVNKTSPKHENVHQEPTYSSSEESQDDFDSGIQQKLMDAKVYSQSQTYDNSDLQHSQANDNISTEPSMTKISPGVFQIQLKQTDEKETSPNVEEISSISVQDRVNDVEKRILENIRGEDHPSIQRQRLIQEVQKLSEVNTQTIIKSMVDAGVQCEGITTDFGTNTDQNDEMQTLTESLVLNLEKAGDRLSESDLHLVLEEYRRRQADILAKRATEKKALDEKLKKRLQIGGNQGEVIEDDLDLSGDDEDLLKEYGNMMVKKSLDEEMADYSYSSSDGSSYYSSSEDEVPQNKEQTEAIKASLKTDIKSNIKTMSASDFRDLLTLFRREQNEMKNARESEKSRLNQSLWLKLQDNKHGDISEDSNEDSQDEHTQPTAQVVPTESKAAPTSDEITSRDQFVDVVMGLIQRKDNVREDELKALLQIHLAEVNDMKNIRDQEKSKLDQKLQEKLLQKQEDDVEDDEQLDEINTDLCRTISKKGQTLNKHELCMLLEEHRELQEEIINQQEMERARLDDKLKERIRHVQQTKAEQDNVTSDDTLNLEEAQSVPKQAAEYADSSDASSSDTESFQDQHLTLEQKIQMVHKEAKQGAQAMDGEFYQRLQAMNEHGHLPENIMDALLEDHLDKVERFQRGKEREGTALHRRLERELQRRRKEREERAQEEQDGEEINRRLQEQTEKKYTEDASHLVHEHHEKSEQMRQMRYREKDLMEQKLQEKLQRRRKKHRGSSKRGSSRRSTEEDLV